MTLQIFPYDCFQDNASMFSELLLEEGVKDIRRIGHRGDGDNFILYFYLMSVQGTWMHKSSSKANYKMTGMSLLKIKLSRLCFYVRKMQIQSEGCWYSEHHLVQFSSLLISYPVAAWTWFQNFTLHHYCWQISEKCIPNTFLRGNNIVLHVLNQCFHQFCVIAGWIVFMLSLVLISGCHSQTLVWKEVIFFPFCPWFTPRWKQLCFLL